MPVLSIRSLPDDVARALKRIAGERGQSVESLVRSTLVALAMPSLHAGEEAFWSDVRSGLRRGDAEAFDEACEGLDDQGAAYEALKLG
jgi:plasmid stability protein